MTTDAQPPQDGEWIPRYFSDFRREFDAFKDENARQHVELAGRISGLEVHVAERISSLETRIAQMEARSDVARSWGSCSYRVACRCRHEIAPRLRQPG